MREKIFILFLALCVGLVSAQTVESYGDDKEESGKSFLDPSKFNINHSVSFGMASSSQYSGLKSQSLYTTMMSYKFSKPVTLDLNFSLPIHSTFSSDFNLNKENVQSLEYFKNMPVDAHLTWRPNEKFAMQLSVIRNTGAQNPYLFSPYSSYSSPLYRWRDW